MIQVTALAAPGFLPSASDLSFRVSDFNIISFPEILKGNSATHEAHGCRRIVRDDGCEIAY